MTEEGTYSGLHPSLRYVLATWMGWNDLRPVQKKTLKEFGKNLHLLILSPTAGGKSEAAFIPVIDQILKTGVQTPFCLYISPLKALINNMAERLETILSPLQLGLAVYHGDISSGSSSAEEFPVSRVIILTTPETLMVQLFRQDISSLSGIRYCIIDELHALAGSERGSQVLSGISRLEQSNGTPVIRIGLSATVGNPEEILDWMADGSPGILIRDTGEIRMHEFRLYPASGRDPPSALVSEITGTRSLVFTGSRREAEMLASALQDTGTPVKVHHSSLSSGMRKNSEELTHGDHPFTVICTSTLELGIDIGNLDQVIQIGSPLSVSSFLQRLGRSGRRDAHPVMCCYPKTCEETCLMVSLLVSASRGVVEPVIPPRFPYDLLVREILLTVLAGHRVSRLSFRSLLGKSPYLYITRERLDELVRHLIENGWLIPDGDLIIPGDTCELLRRSPGILYSVIGGNNRELTVTEDGEEIGRIPVKSAGEGSFLLGGTAWERTGDNDDKTLAVNPAKGPAYAPVWQNRPSEMSRLILAGLSRLLAGMEVPFPVPEPVMSDIESFRSRFPPGIRLGVLLVTRDRNGFFVYTFLGRAWNRVISGYLVKTLSCRSLKTDDYSLSLAGRDLTAGGIMAAIRTLQASSWEGLAERTRFSGDDPVNQSQKRLLPESCIREMWSVDHLQLPLLIETVASREVIWNGE